MKPTKFVITLLLLAASFSNVGLAAAADVEAGLLAVKSLGGLNGQALACSELKVAMRAKALMLAHAPKTQRFGDAYDDATKAAYAEQLRPDSTCPDSIQLTQRANELALRLTEQLPVTAPR
jgi:hypothetical protein